MDELGFCLGIICEDYGQFLLALLLAFCFLALLAVHLISCKPKCTEDTKRQGRDKLTAMKNPSKRTDLYSAAIQLIVHGENTSWARMNIFLLSNSILMLAWAAIFVSPNTKGKGWLLVALSLLGFLLSIAWAPFGSRGRKYLRRYVDVGLAIEQGISPRLSNGPLNAGEKLSFLRWERICRSQHLVVVVPLLFAAAFFFVCLKSICLVLVP
jgi:hypothetical protein